MRDTNAICEALQALLKSTNEQISKGLWFLLLEIDGCFENAMTLRSVMSLEQDDYTKLFSCATLSERAQTRDIRWC
jgi:hypothetical protein